MNNFIDTVETIPEGLGFNLFGPLHLAWLALGILVITFVSLYYRRLDEQKAKSFRKIIAYIIVSDEIWKMFWLTLGGRYKFCYLPFHLCSVNIFLILYHSYRPSKAVDNFLYTVGIPGAMMAMLFPTWTELPLFNFMHLHSFSIHILLMLYPIMLLVRGDIKPDIRQLPKSFAILAVLAVIALGINLLLDINFMFLMYVDPGNPLYPFYDIAGTHLAGFPVYIALLVMIMYGPIIIKNRIRHSS